MIATRRERSAFFNHTFRMNPLIDQAAVRQRVKRLIAELPGKGTQAEFAEAVDIQAGMLSKLMSGKRDFTLGQLIDIERGTNARLAWLILGIDPMHYASGEAPDRLPVEHYEGYRLKRYLEKNDISQTELGRRIGRSKTTIQGYFDTENISPANLKIILDELDAPYTEVFSIEPLLGVTALPASLSTSIKDSISIPMVRSVTPVTDMKRVVRIPIDAREGFIYDDYFSVSNNPNKQTVEVPASWLKEGKEHAVIEVNGDAIGVHPGRDVLAYVVDLADWPYVERIVAIEFRGRFQVKQVVVNDLHESNGTLTLSSGNGSTFRVPRTEIDRIWQVIRDMGGPL